MAQENKEPTREEFSLDDELGSRIYNKRREIHYMRGSLMGDYINAGISGTAGLLGAIGTGLAIYSDKPGWAIVGGVAAVISTLAFSLFRREVMVQKEEIREAEGELRHLELEQLAEHPELIKAGGD